VAEQIKIVKLNCANCGGVLEIHRDMDQFACGYCGSAQIVERRGGTVALRLVVDAVARVQVGTDKTAAELALVRLEKELASTYAQWQAASVNFSRGNSSSSTPAIVTMIGAVIFVAITLGKIQETFSNPGTLALLTLAALGAAIAIFILALKQNAAAAKRYAEKRSEFDAPYEKRIQRLEPSIKESREIVNGPPRRQHATNVLPPILKRGMLANGND
jgi:ribosomal protein S27AE